MSNFNVTIKRYDTLAWHTIYPKTIAANIISGTFDTARIPSLDASKVTTGEFGVDRIPNLSANKITSDVLSIDRIPNIPANKVTGTLDASNLPAVALTNVFTYTTLALFVTNVYSLDIQGVQEGDVVICTTDKQTYIHNGGTAGTTADFTVLQTPTDVVTSVAGKTGIVTLVKADVGLGNVDNTSDANKPVSTAQQTALNLKADKVSITGATKAKITYNSQGIVTAGADLVAADIPALDAGKITTGSFAISRITNLQTELNNRQLAIVLTTEALLSGISASDGMIAYVQD